MVKIIPRVTFLTRAKSLHNGILPSLQIKNHKKVTKGGTRFLRMKLSRGLFCPLWSEQDQTSKLCVTCSILQNLLKAKSPSGTSKGPSSAGLLRAIHLAALGESVCAVQAVQEIRGQFRNQIPVNGCLDHAVDGTQACGLRFRILHDLGDRFPDVL